MKDRELTVELEQLPPDAIPVLRCTGPLSEDQLDRIQEAVKEAQLPSKVLVLDKDMELTVVGEEKCWFRRWPGSPRGWVQTNADEVEWWRGRGFEVAEFGRYKQKDAREERPSTAD